MNRKVEHNCKKLKKHINMVMDKCIPSKTKSTRYNLLWLNDKKKQRMYNKVKKSKKNKDWEDYNTHKSETKNALKSATWNLG